MRYSVLALALAASSHARAAQAEKRGIITISKFVDIWKTVFLPAQAAATPAAVAAPSAAIADAAPVEPSAAPSEAAAVVSDTPAAARGLNLDDLLFGRRRKSSAQPLQASSTKPIVVASSVIAPISSAVAPVSSAIAPISSVVAPISSAAAPFSSVVAPISSVVALSSSAAAPPATSSVAVQRPVSSVVASQRPVSSVIPVQSSPIAAASSAQVASAAAPAASGSGMSATYINDVISHHNAHRSNHSAPDIAWSEPLATRALEIAKTCVYGHVTDNGAFGQNIAAGMPVSRIGFVISDQFYNGEVNSFTYYGQPTPDMDTFHNYGHFTAVVWVNTATVGCASFDCSKTGLQNTAKNVPSIFHVCNYGPGGMRALIAR